MMPIFYVHICSFVKQRHCRSMAEAWAIPAGAGYGRGGSSTVRGSSRELEADEATVYFE
jgi:hypothetical protein